MVKKIAKLTLGIRIPSDDLVIDLSLFLKLYSTVNKIKFKSKRLVSRIIHFILALVFLSKLLTSSRYLLFCLSQFDLPRHLIYLEKLIG